MPRGRRVLAIVGRGRMGAAFRASVTDGYAAVRGVSGHAAAAGRVRRGADPVTWVLAVPDRALGAVAAGLAPVLGRRDVVLHLAGVLGPDALSAARAAGASAGALHPLAAVAAARPAPSLRGAAFLFEGDRRARAEARRLAGAAGGRLIVAARVERGAYHGAAALVATGAVALAQGAAALLAAAVTPAPAERDVRAAVVSLLTSVARNVAAVGVDRALASPLLRDDTTTVARHLAAMAAQPAVRELYRAAVALVLDALEREALVAAETVARARALVARSGPG